MEDESQSSTYGRFLELLCMIICLINTRRNLRHLSKTIILKVYQLYSIQLFVPMAVLKPNDYHWSMMWAPCYVDPRLALIGTDAIVFTCLSSKIILLICRQTILSTE
jgi:hypothetical protein